MTPQRKGIPVTLTSSTIWAVTTAAIAFAGNHLWSAYIDQQKLESAHAVEQRTDAERRALLIPARDRELDNMRTEITHRMDGFESRLLSVEEFSRRSTK